MFWNFSSDETISRERYTSGNIVSILNEYKSLAEDNPDT
jgi:hypothetical protein